MTEHSQETDMSDADPRLSGQSVDDKGLGEYVAEPSRGRRMLKWLGMGLAGLILFGALGLLVLNSPLGKRFVANQIAKIAPASGLRMSVGRIEGDLFGEAKLHDVILKDPEGVFLTVPYTELDWKPLNFLISGLDIRNFVAERGQLHRVPQLLPGDPDAPILPNFDIRIDRLALINFTVSSGVIDDQDHRVDLQASADIRSGRTMINSDGTFGKKDAYQFVLDAEPDGDNFDLSVDYSSESGGVLAGLLGADAGYQAQIKGDGTWSKWDGTAEISRNSARFLTASVKNRSGRFTLGGRVDAAKLVDGLAARLASSFVDFGVVGTLEDSVFDGEMAIKNDRLKVLAEGAIDLDGNMFDDVALQARLLDSGAMNDKLILENLVITGVADGAFRDLTITHRLTIDRLAQGNIAVQSIAQSSHIHFDGDRWTMPVDVAVSRVVTEAQIANRQLEDGSAKGDFYYHDGIIGSDSIKVAFPNLEGDLAISGSIPRDRYAITGPVRFSRFAVDNIGLVKGTANIALTLFNEGEWNLITDLDAKVNGITNTTLVNLAGPSIGIKGGAAFGSQQLGLLRNMRLFSDNLTMNFDGSVAENVQQIEGRGQQREYGDFTVAAKITEAGPVAELEFESPLPQADLRNVHIALSPDGDGFAIATKGDSILGPFDGDIHLTAPENAPVQIDVERFSVWKTSVTGNLKIVDGAAAGGLRVLGGGLDGRIGLATRDNEQGFAIDLKAANARFTGPTPISLAEADIDIQGSVPLGKGTAKPFQMEGSVYAEGLSYGTFFLGKMAGEGRVRGGAGVFTASVAGRRGGRFNLQVNGDVTQERTAIAAQGSFAGKRIRLPRRAIIRSRDDGGYTLEPTQLIYGKGAALAQGTFGADDTQFLFHMEKMPLSLADLAVADLGLGGTISGIVEFAQAGQEPPVADAKVKIDNLTRSGLVLTSSPIDFALVGKLNASDMTARAVINEGGAQRGRVQARIYNLPRTGDVMDRLQAGSVSAGLQYNGPSGALWRLAAIEGFDLTGPVSVAASVTGSLADPSVRGKIASDNLRMRSLVSGTDIRSLAVRGIFNGSRLSLTQFAGVTKGDGTVSGSGTIDLEDLDKHGPVMDIRIAANKARLLNALGLRATISGPLRIISNGKGGTIAGRVSVSEARWRLGELTAIEELPLISTTEINRANDIAPSGNREIPWRYLVDAKANNRIYVEGMGLDSEWRADIALRGTTVDPRIGGNAEVLRGSYSFAGTRFDLTRGEIEFDVNTELDPQIDIRAETQKDGIDVAVLVQGRALRPEIEFDSNPSLPQDEVLARLLFGGSVADLSATDAVQLGAALASLRGGGGLNPINKLRSAVGLDRLRLVNSDPALNRGTSVAMGKNLGRKVYVEIITDGQGYNATEAEFRLTNWLSLLGAISTIGRESIVAEVSRDY